MKEEKRPEGDKLGNMRSEGIDGGSESDICEGK